MVILAKKSLSFPDKKKRPSIKTASKISHRCCNTWRCGKGSHMSNEIVSLWDAEIEYKKNRILALSFAGIATERIVAQKKPPMGSRRLKDVSRGGLENKAFMSPYSRVMPICFQGHFSLKLSICEVDYV